jgi:hypothetical protein
MIRIGAENEKDFSPPVSLEIAAEVDRGGE